MKIVHALAYYGEYLGGIQSYVKELAKRQREEGNEVKIITSDLYGEENQIDKIPVIRVKSWFSAFRVPFIPGLPIKLLKEDCDILHVHLPLPGLDLSAALKKWIHPKTKLIITLHNYIPINSKLSKIFSWFHNKFLISPALKASDRIVVTTKAFADSLPYKLPSRKINVISLGVDFKYFYPNKRYNKNQVLFVGRMIPEKGLHILMESMNSVRKHVNGAKLLAICSETYDYKDYERKIKKLDKYKILTIIKNVPHNKIRKYYADSACFVMPSLDLDSFGFVLIESMACGCPVISSDLPGPSSIVNKNVGLVVPRGNTEELSKAIVYMLKKGEKFRKNCREYAENNFSWEKINKQILGVYRR